MALGWLGDGGLREEGDDVRCNNASTRTDSACRCRCTSATHSNSDARSAENRVAASLVMALSDATVVIDRPSSSEIGARPPWAPPRCIRRSNLGASGGTILFVIATDADGRIMSDATIAAA